MQPREPSMEDILASIKRVIAEEKELRSAVPPAPSMPEEQDDVLELDESMEESSPEARVELGPPLLDEQAAGTTRERLDQLSSLAASAPPPQPQGNPLE